MNKRQRGRALSLKRPVAIGVRTPPRSLCHVTCHITTAFPIFQIRCRSPHHYIDDHTRRHTHDLYVDCTRHGSIQYRVLPTFCAFQLRSCSAVQLSSGPRNLFDAERNDILVGSCSGSSAHASCAMCALRYLCPYAHVQDMVVCGFRFAFPLRMRLARC